MKLSLTLCLALASTVSGFLIKISEKLSTADCQDVLNNLEVLVRSSSAQVSNETGHSALLEEVTVVLPHSWNKAGCAPVTGEVSSDQETDMMISDTHLLWTLQHGGCGHQAHRINVPRHFLMFNQTSMLENKTRQMSMEMIKYMFGVFEEQGFVNDPQYPETYSTGNTSLDNVGCDHRTGLLCSTDHYNRYAPTKQNILCGGRSVREMIPETNVSTAPANVTIRYVTQSVSRYVLVLDLATDHQTWTSVKRALYRFISVIPEGATLSIVTVQPDSDTTVLYPTVVTNSRREGLHGLIPRRSAEVRGCVECGVATALDLLGQDPGTIVILSNTGVNMETRGHRMINIRLGDNVDTDQQQGMIVYSVSDTRHSAYLTEVFTDILNNSEDQKLEKIFHAEHEDASQFSGTFYVEEETNNDVTVTLTIDDEQKVESFEVKDSTGKRNIFSKFEDGLVIIKMLGKSNSGMWSYHVKLYDDVSGVSGGHRAMLDVTSRSVDTGVSVSALPSTSVDGHQVLVVSVTRDQAPVVGAEVSALVSGPGGHITLSLRDNGLGYPDTTQADGLYSALVPVFAREAGHYSVRVSVTSTDQTMVSTGVTDQRCCGSSVQYQHQDSITHFSRHLSIPALFISQTNPMMKDLTPPSRITDLKVVSANVSSLMIQLGWTAPGGDLDSGSVSGYEIRCHTDPTLLLDSSFSDKGIMVHPASPLIIAGYLSGQEASVGVPWTNQMFYYALVSRDQEDNVSPVSNIVSVIINEVITSTESSSLAPSQLKLGGQTWLLDTTTILAIAGGCGGVLLIIIIIVVVMICKAKKRNKEKQSKDVLDTYEAGFYPDIKLSKPEPAADMVTDGSVYNWLDGLQQTRDKSGVKSPGVTVKDIDLCYEEGSSCSRPTTSTDDSVSNEETSTEYRTHSSAENNNNTAAEMQHAAAQLQRQRMYSNSVKYPSHVRYPAYNNPHRYGPAPGHHAAPAPGHGPYVSSSSGVMLPSGVKKQRHESVV